MKKIIVACIVFLFIGMFILPVTNSISTSTNNDDTEYWAVIVGIADYDGDGILLGNDLPVPRSHMTDLYYKLISNDNWDENNVKLLLNDNAKRNDILDAIDWLKNRADSNDVIIFSYQGHGSAIPDDDGDEQDGLDEGIVAWEGLSGFITDDELDEKFDEINCEGMFLVFHSCISGGLIDKSSNGGFQKSEQYTKEFSTDIQGSNRVISMSSMDGGLALAYPMLTRKIARGLEGKADFNKDGIITAEELAEYGRNEVIKNFLAFFILFPPAILSFAMAEIFAKLMHGFWALPIPTTYDGYSGDLPIII